LFAGNNINSATETAITLVEEAEKTFNGTNTGGQFLNNCTFSGSNVTGASGSGVADLDLYQGLMVRYTTTGTPPTINAGGDASNGGSTSALVNNRTYFIESSFQVGSSINYVTTLKEFPTSASNINFTSTGTGTHTFTVIGIATDKDIFHLKNHGYVVGDMLRYTYPSAARFTVNTPLTEEKDYYFVERLFGAHNFQVNFTIGELTPKLQEFIGLTASSSSVNVSFTASGFTAPLTWSVTSGTLPSGLSLNTSTGAITGTPNAAYSQATIRITVTDAAASSDFADVTFQINPPPFLYDQTTVTFTPGGATGSFGPSAAQARSGAGNPSWGSTYINTSASGVILWTVGRTGTYNMTLAGARGGRNSGNNQQGGQGAVGSINGVSLTQGEVLRIVAGQVGTAGPGRTGEEAGGGGGASFVHRNGAGSPIAVAAGGGGGSANQTGMSISSDNRGLAARLVNSGSTGGGQGNYGGPINGTHEGAGGAGWTGDGFWSPGGPTTDRLGRALNNTATGGLLGDGGGLGGFGGGGTGGRNNGSGGGGGGYQGGWGGVYGDPGQGSSGTGGQSGSGGWGFGLSYSGYNNGDGYVTITRV
jgi:hypothetical protein